MPVAILYGASLFWSCLMKQKIAKITAYNVGSNELAQAPNAFLLSWTAALQAKECSDGARDPPIHAEEDRSKSESK